MAPDDTEVSCLICSLLSLGVSLNSQEPPQLWLTIASEVQLCVCEEAT